MRQDVDLRAAPQSNARDCPHERGSLATAEFDEIVGLNQYPLRRRRRAAQVGLQLIRNVVKASEIQPEGPLSIQTRIGPPALAMLPKFSLNVRVQRN